MSQIKLQLTGADIGQGVSRLNKWGITVYDWQQVDEITAVISVKTSDYEKTAQLVRYGFQVKILHDPRVAYISIIQRRWILIFGIVFLLVLSAYLPTRVFFFQVEGNHLLPEKLILEKAEDCGIYFGAVRKNLRSEQVKNQLLQLLPQLQWAGINTQGCVAVISVKERQPEETEQLTFEGVGNIVCARDGVIQSVTVLQGSSRCKPGQAVRKGER